MEPTQEVIGYSTLQFHWGGLFDSVTTDNLIHLVRRIKHGTPGRTLCGINRFAAGAPGFSVGGGLSTVTKACAVCNQVREGDLPVSGLNSSAFQKEGIL